MSDMPYSDLLELAASGQTCVYIERLEAIIDAHLCEDHASSVGLYGYQEGDGVTPSGGGCVVCIGERVEAELEHQKEIVRELADFLAYQPYARTVEMWIEWAEERIAFRKGGGSDESG